MNKGIFCKDISIPLIKALRTASKGYKNLSICLFVVANREITDQRMMITVIPGNIWYFPDTADLSTFPQHGMSNSHM